MKQKIKSATRRYERLLEVSKQAHYLLRLYVTGVTPASTHAVANLTRICEEHLKGRYQLQVIDIYQQPELARSGNIIVAPTLVKQLPLPIRRLIGDLSDMQGVLAGLDLLPHPGAADSAREGPVP